MTAQTIQIQELIRQYKVREAFWAAADDIMNDTQKQTLFLQILSFKNNVAILQTDSDKIRQQAEHGGNPYMAYAYARLHDVLQVDENSNNVKEMYYTIAANHDIGDAFACLAYMYRDGDLGEMMDDHDIDSDEYDDGHEYLYDGDPEFLLQMEPEREIEED